MTPQGVAGNNTQLQTQTNLGVESWIFTDPFSERLAYEVDPQWGGELPFTLLIAGDGSVKSITGAVDFLKLRDWANREAQGLRDSRAPSRRRDELN